MTTFNGSLNFDARIANTDFNRTIQDMQQRLVDLSSTANQETGKIGKAFSLLGQLAGDRFASMGLSDLPAEIIRVRGEFQKLEISLGTLLQNKELAGRMMKDIMQFAAATPFGTEDTATAAKQLLMYGENAGTVMKTLEQLGDVAVGINAPLSDVAALYAQVKSQGGLDTDLLDSFNSINIPMVPELAKMFNVATQEVKGLVEAGKVGFPEVQQALNNMTAEGAIFGGLMAAEASSISGLQDQLRGAFENIFNEIGQRGEGAITALLEGSVSLLQNYEKVVDVLTVVTAAYGAYRTALAITAALQNSSALAAAIANWWSYARTIKSVTDLQTLLNLTIKANPYTLVAAGVAALATGLIAFNKETDRVSVATKDAAEAFADESSKVKALVNQINNETLSRDLRNQKLRELKALYPEALKGLNAENIATAEGTKILNGYIESLRTKIKYEKMQAELTASLKREELLNSGQADLPWTDVAGAALKSGGSQTEFMKQMALASGEYVANQLAAEKSLQKRLSSEMALLELGKHSGGGGGGGRGARSNVGPFGSISYWEDVIKKAEEASQLIPGFNTAALRKQADIIKFAQGEIEDIRKSIAIASLEDELAEKRKQYELYERWVQHMGKETADAQFAELLKGGASYATFLDSEIARITDKGQLDPLSEEDNKQLFTLKNSKADINGDGGLQDFRKKLEEVRTSSESLTEELIKLREIQSQLGSRDTSKQEEVAKRILAVEKERRTVLADFLSNIVGSKEKELEINRKYDNLQAALDKEHADKKGEAYQKASAEIVNARKKELEQSNLEALKQSQGYRELERVVKLSTAEQTQIRVDAARKQLDEVKASLGEESDAYVDHLLKLRKAEEEHRQKRINDWKAIAGAAGEVGDILSGFGGTMGEIGGAISGLSSQAGNIASLLTMKEGDSLGTTQYIAAAQGVINIIGGIIQASKQRAEAEKKFAVERLGLENDYQLALIKNTGKNFNDNPYYTDYDGKIKAGVAQFKAANEKYQEAIAKLENEGRAKLGQKDVVDGKSMGKMIGAGATIGATIGSFFPGLGNVIGAGVGALVGFGASLFAKKKKDVYGDLMELYPGLVKEAADGWAEIDVEMAKALITNNQVDDKTKEMLNNAIELNQAMEEARQQIRDTLVDMTGQIGDKLKNALVEAFRSGNDAAQALKQTVGGIIADMVTNLVFSKIIGPILDNFLIEAEKSLTSEEGDGTIVDDLMRLGDALGPAAVVATEILEGTSQQLEKAGFNDAFGKTGNGKGNRSMEGAIKGMSEETASLLAGQFNAIRIYNAEMAFNIRTSVMHLANIEANTSYNWYLTKLDTVIERLDRINNTSMRGFGL